MLPPPAPFPTYPSFHSSDSQSARQRGIGHAHLLGTLWRLSKHAQRTAIDPSQSEGLTSSLIQLVGHSFRVMTTVAGHDSLIYVYFLIARVFSTLCSDFGFCFKPNRTITRVRDCPQIYIRLCRDPPGLRTRWPQAHQAISLKREKRKREEEEEKRERKIPSQQAYVAVVSR